MLQQRAGRSATLVVTLALLATAAHAGTPATTIFTSGDDGYHTFRIPVVVEAQNGDLLAFAEGRKNGRGDAGDIDIVMKRSTDRGQTWGKLQLVQDEWNDPEGKITIGNPVALVDALDPVHPGRIWLVFCRNNRRVFVTCSDDHGATWSRRTEITPSAKRPSWGWYATGPVHGIQLTRSEHAGRLIVPADHQKAEGGDWGAHLLLSDDHGATWRIGATDTHPASSRLHPNECVAVELTDGRLYVNARDQLGSDPATRGIAYSSDGGLTFDAPFAAESDLTAPVVQASALRCLVPDESGNEQDILVFCAPGHASRRRDLTIWLSFDEGASWNVQRLLQPGPAAYCDLVMLDQTRLGILFEAGEPLYQRINFAALDLAPLIEKSRHDGRQGARRDGAAAPREPGNSLSSAAARNHTQPGRAVP